MSHIELNQKGMGSLSIFSNGTEIYTNSIGFSSIEKSMPSNKKTKYRIASITKTFTATLIMQLIEEGKLSLQTTLDKYYPEIENADIINIKHLLQHRSGIFNFTNTSGYRRYMESYISKEDLLKQIIKLGSIFEPGDRSNYSNSNYILLTFIIEKIEGKTYKKVLEERIIKKLGLKQTYLGAEIDVTFNEATSYTMLSDWAPTTETDMSFPLGAGALVSTSTDVNKFMVALFNGKLVQMSTLEKMKEMNGRYGIGLFGFPFQEKHGFGHSGGIDGFQSLTVYYPKDRLSVTYTSNAVDYPLKDLFDGLLSIYHDRTYEFPNFKDPQQLKIKSLESYLGRYSNPSIPQAITIFKKKNQLFAKLQGLEAVKLSALKKHRFKNDELELLIEFIPNENLMILKQGTSEHELIKE